MQILLGLQAPAVSRLEKSWQRIDPYEKQIFNELKEMAKPFRNWKNVRDTMSKAVEDIAESPAVESVLAKAPCPSMIGCRGCIPFLGKSDGGGEIFEKVNSYKHTHFRTLSFGLGLQCRTAYLYRSKETSAQTNPGDGACARSKTMRTTGIPFCQLQQVQNHR
jgi:hypothetical protein